MQGTQSDGLGPKIQEDPKIFILYILKKIVYILKINKLLELKFCTYQDPIFFLGLDSKIFETGPDYNILAQCTPLDLILARKL